MDKVTKQITGRLSLRYPQRESLEILAQLLESIQLSKEPNLKADIEAIQSIFSSVQDFERDFPSICFALATGVGKTRLMGAFISYLYLTRKSRNFCILAPNLTIYEKLKEDFSNPHNLKYVFAGILEFVNHPIVITGENYDSGIATRLEKPEGVKLEYADAPFINIFNISKINATENKKGTAKSSTPRIKRLQETIGESYFDYLSNLPDLVLLMDEAHRYRAIAGAKVINELKPVLGIELTATPKTTGAKPVDFKNCIYAYSLSEAMQDGFVKEPAVATRKDFKPKNYSPEELEKIKLEDGIHHHEHVKVELDVYAQNYDKKLVKPFMLVVAKDTEHARKIRKLLESDGFFNGSYKGKVAEVHSKQSGSEEDDNIQRLISIENPKEPTEIVIHVNKLKEGWDVTNLYTLVPLRASASEILTEQTIGRGLRLPYGQRTGVETLDRLTIIAHDKFQDIVDRANDENSLIKKKIEIGEGGDISEVKSQTITVQPQAELVLAESPQTENLETQQRLVDVTMQVAKGFEHLKSSKELSKPEIQKQIVKKVLEATKPHQGTLKLEADTKEVLVKEVVDKVTKNLATFTIDIPNIVLIPDREVNYGFRDFDLEGLDKLNYQPVSQEILIQQLRTNERNFLVSAGGFIKESRLENYIIRGLIDNDLVDYDNHSDLLHKLAGQVVARFKSYLSDEQDIENVLIHYQAQVTEFIIKQIRKYYWEKPIDYQIKVSRGFTILKPFHCSLAEGATPRDFRSIPKEKNQVKKLVFNGFTKCCYPLQKFDSVEGELRFAQILEDDASVMRWMKPAPGCFRRIVYKNGVSYEPDFVVETLDAKYLCEPKRASEMKSETVLAKKQAAELWCQHATQHARDNGGKPWKYVIISHDTIKSNRSFAGLISEYRSSM